MPPRDPFNITIIDPEEYIERKGCLPVTVHSMYEPSTSRFHPDGLFSEIIFGQIGTPERIAKRGYMDLHTTIITPHLYKQLLSLKGYYKDILSGREYAIFDEELQDFVKVEREHPDAQTGYSFFVNNLSKVVFKDTGSIKRRDKIELLKKYHDRILMTKYIIIPAGIRDVKEKNGRTTSEDINKLYLGLLSLTQAMPSNGSDDIVFDAIRYQIQNKVQQIYSYITDMLDGKGGFAQSKYAARSIVWANRNVLTAAPMSRVIEPDAPNMFGANEVLVPLFQGMKSATPLVINKLKSVFFDVVFQPQSLQVPLIDPDTYELKYYDLTVSEIKKYTTSDGLTDLINEFRDLHMHAKPVLINVESEGKKSQKYFMLVYDNGDFVYYLRNVEDFRAMLNSKFHKTPERIEGLDTLSPDTILSGNTACAIHGYDEVIPKESIAMIRSVDDAKLYDPETESLEKFRSKCCEKINEVWAVKPIYLLEFYKREGKVKDMLRIKFLEEIVFDPTKLRPLTWIELFYCAAHQALKDRYCTATRHPVLNVEGIVPSKVHLVSTSPSRVVTMKVHGNESLAQDVLLPEYPILGEKAKTSFSVNPVTLEKYDGDHDGVCTNML